MKTIKFPNGQTDRVSDEEAAHMIEAGQASPTCKRHSRRRRPTSPVIPTPKTVERFPKTRICNNRKLTKGRRSNYILLKAAGGVALTDKEKEEKKFKDMFKKRYTSEYEG